MYYPAIRRLTSHDDSRIDKFFMHLRLHRADGKFGKYHQDDLRRAQVLARRFDPATLFCSGPVVIGMLNPFSVIHPDEICWVEVETELKLKLEYPQNVETIRKLSGRGEYEEVLARQWPLWRINKLNIPGDMLEAVAELSFRGGEMLYLHITGRVADAPLPDLIYGAPAISATISPHGALYINPKGIVRARVYHSRGQVEYPMGLWFADAEDI
ncbi:MAG: hypothetical protein ABL931_03780 [Usitatibacteraceae bacterium]